MKISIKQSKKIPIISGVSFVLLFALLIFLNPEPISGWLDFLENRLYDLQLRHSHRPPISSTNPIRIVDVDDKSLNAEGRWPWPRKKIAILVQKLYQQGAKVVAFDITFSEKQENIAQELINVIQKRQNAQAAVDELEAIKPEFNYDDILASSVNLGKTVLGIIFLNDKQTEGVIPSPLFTLPSNLSEELLIPRMEGFIGNLEMIQNKAASGGFINALPDADGVLRFSPILMNYNGGIYTALSLEAVRLFLGIEGENLEIKQYGSQSVLEGVQIGSITVPLTPAGKILIPFRAASYSFPYISATDVLQDRVPQGTLTNTLVFLGSSASALGDLFPSSIESIFPGIEVHASIAAGILDGYLPYRPGWMKGAVVAMILFFGLLCAIVLPYLTPIFTALFSIAVVIVLFLINHWMWVDQKIILPVFLPVFAVLFLYAIDVLGGYFFETRGRQEIRHLFNQYVSPLYIDTMLEKESSFTLMGENKELTVFFSDIRHFTTLSEKMTAPILKQFLDRYFTAMTEVIFHTNGTIDKYIGDAIMAFWGAPLDNPKHAHSAVATALNMQKELSKFNALMKNQQFPEVQIGIGINTGSVHVGDMGSQFRRNYTVIGDCVNIASRLEQLTKLYQVGIIIGEATYEKTRQDFIYRKLDKVQAKGKTVPIEIYQPIDFLEQETEVLRRELELHHRALDHYFQKRWEEAQKLFEQLAKEYPEHQSLYQVYLNRMKTMPLPGPTWDGTCVLETK